MGAFVDISAKAKLWLILAILLIAVASLVSSALAGDFQIAVALGFAVYAFTVSLALFLRDPSLGWFHPLIFMALWWGIVRYVLPLIPVLFYGLDHHLALVGATQSELNEIAGIGFLLSSLGLLAFYAGYFLTRPVSLPQVNLQAPSFPFVTTLVLVAISLAATALLAREAGGLGNLMLQRGIRIELRIEEQLGGRHWHFLAGLAPLGCLFWLSFNPGIWKHPGFLALFAISLATVFVTTGSRSSVILPVIMAGSIWSLNQRRLPILTAFLIAGLALTFIGVGGQFRTLSRDASSVETIEVDTSPLAQIERGVKNVFRYGGEVDGLFAIIGRVPDQVEFLYGESYLSLLFIPVPSVLLPFEKPRAGGQITATRLFGMPNSGVPPGNIGEAYFNFHLPGVVLVMFLFGALMRTFAYAYSASGQRPFDCLFYVFTLFTLQPNTTALYDWVQGVGVIFVLMVIYTGLPLISRRRGLERQQL